MITLQIPTDVDVRVMLTFLELYQTLLGFVLFKLYTDAGLVYPPPLDLKKNDGGAGVGAFSLQEMVKANDVSKVKTVDVDGRKISTKDVRQTIKDISSSKTPTGADDIVMSNPEAAVEVEDEDFVPIASTSLTDAGTSSLHTFKSLEALPSSTSTTLFASCTFFLSRETSRPIFEFLVRSFGGRIGWEASVGSGSPYSYEDASITHVIIDRPVLESTTESPEERQRRLSRKYVQPQWVVDSINAGRVLLEDTYAPGKTLPPHLSPFGEAYEGAYDPMSAADGEEEVSDQEDEMDGVEDTAALKITDESESSIRAAELAAEVAGVDPAAFEKKVKKATKQKQTPGVPEEEEDMNKMMMSKRQKKLYEKVKHSQQKRATEVCFALIFMVCYLRYSQRSNLEEKKRDLQKEKRKKEKT